MGSQAIGFQFQGDVIGGSSLLYTATGRLLKALNNDGIDFYAVAASVQLGKLLPLTQEREAAISQLLAHRRTSRESYLSKALRIGWGHTDIPHELARTKAGVSALNIIGAFATGCKPFESAKALSSLMEMYGCEAESLPSLDSLSTMIDCLSPFVTNSTFDAVIANIKLACMRVLNNNCLKVPNALDIKGDNTQWARIVKHLVTTSSALEQAHIAVGQRGVWMSAFAAHILGMSVTVYFMDVILWESAGPHGSVTLYLRDGTPLYPSLTQSLPADIQLEWVEPSIDSTYEPNMLLLSQLFESGMAWVTTAHTAKQASWSGFDETMIHHLRAAIHHSSETLFDNVKMRLNRDKKSIRWPINGYSSLRKQPLQAALQHIGVLSLNQARPTNHNMIWTKSLQRPKDDAMIEHVRIAADLYDYEQVLSAFEHLHDEIRVKVSKLCGWLDESDEFRIPKKACLCCRSAMFIFQMSALAVALAQCSYDQKSIRINERMLREWRVPYSTSHQWLEQAAHTHSSTVYFDSLFAYLVRVLNRHERDQTDQFKGYDLAWSEGGITIYNRALFDGEFPDNYGRVLAITSGQVSCNGLRRKLVSDTGSFDFWLRRENQMEGTFNTFDVNTEMTPFLAKGPINHSTIIEMESTTVGVKIQLLNREEDGNCDDKFTTGLVECTMRMLATCRITGLRCRHESQEPYVVRKAHSPVAVHTFGIINRTLDLKTTQTLVFAVSGSSLSQMLQVFLLHRSGYQVALQRDSCLSCIITEVKKSPERIAILMS